MNINKLNRYIEQTMKNFPNVDSIIIADTKAIIRYYFSSYGDISKVGNEIIGKHIFDIYPELSMDNSYIIKCIETGKSFINYEQQLTDVNGTTLRTICSTVPIHDNGQLVAVAELSTYPDKTIEEKENKIEIASFFKEEQKVQNTLEDIITACPQIINIKEHIKNNADSDAPVLVYGKTGTGKELIVNAIHKSSKRANGPFIVQNCAAIPSTLLESILFGNVKGSFTGAENSVGLFEQANHGTLFLDEINSMEMEAQAKILRAIEEKKIRRIGDKKTIDVDVRIIAAVNKDPIKCVEENILRDDLYYRLSVIRYDIPPLRDRKEDIPLLMEHFRTLFNKKFNKNIMEYSNEVKSVFLKYDWPGNVRELRNVIESAYHMNFGLTIELDNVPGHIAERMNIERVSLENSSSMTLNELVEEFEKEIIKRKYIKNGKKLSQTARELAISRQSLFYKLKKYGLID